MRKFLNYLTILVATVLILLALASLIHDVVYWYAKVLDFPRIQYLIAAVICLLLFAVLNRRWRGADMALTLGLLATIGIQAAFILPYLVGTPVVPAAAETDVAADRRVSVLIANVLLDNRETQPFIDLVRSADPDMVLTMEVDDYWVERLAVLEADYPHQMKYPADNGYGMALYSRYPLSGGETAFLQTDSVPSFHTEVALPAARFVFHGVHPLAPVPSQHFPDGAGKREVALIKVADKVDTYQLPSIVAGDFNDVSWSNTSRLFGEQTDLRNVRLGRGLYNSFDARSFIMRWPLDHYFVSEEFELLELKRLPKFGSDHFAIFARFTLPPR
jgi:endonuclease/exonuclease/phosphatase (EEP) superfamily protein YafD